MPFGGESENRFPALTTSRPNGRQPYALRFSLKSEAFFISDRLFSKNFITAGMAFKAEPAYGRGVSAGGCVNAPRTTAGFAGQAGSEH